MRRHQGHLHIHEKTEMFNNENPGVETIETTSSEQPCHESPKGDFGPIR